MGNGTYYIRLRAKNACGDLSAASTEITTVVGPTTTTTGTVTLNSLGLTGCTYKTDPFPGYFNCTATAVVTVTKIVRNGWVSVYFNYSADGLLLRVHGGARKRGAGRRDGQPQEPILQECIPTQTVNFDVYDGAQAQGKNPLLSSFKITLNSTCG